MEKQPKKHTSEWELRHEAASHLEDRKLNEHPREDGPDTEKYLEMEQPGVSYTKEGHPTMNSDYFEPTQDDMEADRWKSNGHNSRNADAFSQDDYILNDNIDLDEDQNTSISNEDADR
jgi:hypothetical protein